VTTTLPLIVLGYVFTSLGFLKFLVSANREADIKDPVWAILVIGFFWPIWVPMVVAFAIVAFMANGVWEVL
jgi:hypothetical protein